MAKYASGNQERLRLGFIGNNENDTSLRVVGRVGIGTTIFDSNKSLDIRGDVSIGSSIAADATSGVITATAFHGDGSDITGLTASQVNGAIIGITIQEEDSNVGTVDSVKNINFVSGNLTATASGVGATITLTDDPTFTDLSATNVSASSSITGTFHGDGSNLTDITASQVGALSGVIIREEGGSSLGNIGDINFVSSNLTATASGIAATITLTDDPTFNNVTIADKIVHTGDTNTAIRFPAADTVAVETAGIERLRITSAGNVGINTTVPSEKLDVIGTVKATAFHTGDEGSAIRVTSNTISGPDEITIDPAAVGDNTGSVRIKGDLFIDGTTTQINSTTLEIADFVVGIASTATTDSLADGAGINIGPDNTFKYHYNSGTDPSLKSSENLNVASGKNYQIDQTEVLNATTLGSSVVNSSLTSVGTLTALTVSGNVTANGNIVGDNATNISGINSVTAISFHGDGSNLTDITASQVGALSGVIIREEGGSSLGSVRDINFVSGNLTATASGIGATITLTDDPTFNDVSIADKIIHTGDTDTAIRFPADDTVAVETAGTERLRITSDGNVIIGPGGSWSYPKALNVQGASGSILSLYNADTTSYAQDTSSAIEFKLLTGNTGNTTGACELRAFKENGTNGNNARGLSFWTGVNGGGNNEKLRITSGGQVSIGVVSPYTVGGTHKLCISGSDILSAGPSSTNMFYIRYQGSAGDYAWQTTNSGNNQGSIQLQPYGGNVGIGTDNPTAILDVNGQTELDNLNVSGDISIADKIVHTGDTDTAIRFPDVDTFAVETAGSERLRITSAGNIGIGTTNPTEKLDVIGTVKATDFNTTSDENLKTNIHTIGDPLAKVVQIRGVNFEWKENNKRSAGVIAQEVEKVLPELINGEQTKTVNYNGLIGLLIEVVKEQQIQIDSLNGRLSRLE